MFSGDFDSVESVALTRSGVWVRSCFNGQRLPHGFVLMEGEEKEEKEKEEGRKKRRRTRRGRRGRKRRTRR